MKKVKNKEVYKFKKGDKLHLDHVYHVQGLAGGNWLKHDNKDDDFSDDNLIVTRDVHFEIIEYETK